MARAWRRSRASLQRSGAFRSSWLTVSSAGEDVIAALHAGASSYLLKDATLDDLAGGIRQAARGDAVLSHEIAQTLVAHVRAGEREVTSDAGAGVPLTTRETEVLRLIVGGADNASIGRELSISPHTMEQLCLTTSSRSLTCTVGSKPPFARFARAWSRRLSTEGSMSASATIADLLGERARRRSTLIRHVYARADRRRELVGDDRVPRGRGARLQPGNGTHLRCARSTTW